MSDRYFEVIITGRQMAGVVAAVLLAVVVAFSLGVAVRVLEPTPPQTVIVVATPTPAPATPTPVPALPSPVPPVAATVVQPPATVVAAAIRPARVMPTRTPTVATQPPVPTVVPGGRWVQVAAEATRPRADAVRDRVIAAGFTASQVVIQPGPGGLVRVRVGPLLDEESASRVAARLHGKGFGQAFVVKKGE